MNCALNASCYPGTDSTHVTLEGLHVGPTVSTCMEINGCVTKI